MAPNNRCDMGILGICLLFNDEVLVGLMGCFFALIFIVGEYSDYQDKKVYMKLH